VRAASSPTPFSTASGVLGLIAGPSSALRSLNYRVRLFSSLGLAVAPPACEPDQDTSATYLRVLTTEHRVGRCFWQRVGPMPRVSPLNSQVAFRSQASGVVCNIAGVSEGFHGSCPDRVSSPARTLSLSRLSASFIWLTASRRPPESLAPCWTQQQPYTLTVTAIHSTSKPR
jgi:hypothetical protein